MTPSKWIQNNITGIIIGILICFLIFPVTFGILSKIIVGGLVGGYLYSLISPKKGTGKNYGIWPALPWIITGALTLVGVLVPIFQKQPPTLSEQLSQIPTWAYFVGGFFLLLMLKALRKKPRTIIIQEPR